MFLTPISIWSVQVSAGVGSRTPSGELDFNNTAIITTVLEARRDFTFQISGTKNSCGPVNLEYAVAAVQGAGQNNADNNENKDFAGRAGLTIPDLGLYLGGSAYAGLGTDNDLWRRPK